MTDKPPTSEPEEKLDDTTERLINLLDYRGRRPGYSGPSGTARALRRCIRELQEEARKEERRRPLDWMSANQIGGPDVER